MSNRKADRHRGLRDYKSGSEKESERQEKQKKHKELLSQTHKVTDFFSITQNTSKSPEVSPEWLENNIPTVEVSNDIQKFFF